MRSRLIVAPLILLTLTYFAHVAFTPAVAATARCPKGFLLVDADASTGFIDRNGDGSVCVFAADVPVPAQFPGLVIDDIIIP